MRARLPEKPVRRTIPLSLAVLFLALPSLHALGAQDRHVFNPPGLPSNLPFSNGIQIGDQLWIAGMQGVVTGDVEAETRSTLDNVKKVLDAAGYQPGDVVQVTVYLKDINDFPRMNAVYAKFFPDPKPTRTTVEVARLVNDARVEITAVAVRRHSGSAP
jgi:2-iminobutanoate/2-iminopropanoate deaminase